MKIRLRLLLGLSCIVLVLIAVAGVIIGQQSYLRHRCFVLGQIAGIESLMLQCRFAEKEFLLRRETNDATAIYTLLDSLCTRTEWLITQARDPVLTEKLTRLEDAATAYTAVVKVMAARRELQIDRSQDIMLLDLAEEHASGCHELMGEIRGHAITEMEAVSYRARTVNVVAVLFGLLLSVLIAGVLTRVIVDPIHYLTTLAERVRAGDIQDIDVLFGELKLQRFRDPESRALAESFRKLVSNLRERVVSERGLMDPYHMTIAVMVLRAAGPEGWAVIERARARAGLESFGTVAPANIEQFIEGLREEMAGQLDEERIGLLARALREIV
jgi:CHASE3 domain sensor protein